MPKTPNYSFERSQREREAVLAASAANKKARNADLAAAEGDKKTARKSLRAEKQAEKRAIDEALDGAREEDLLSLIRKRGQATETLNWLFVIDENEVLIDDINIKDFLVVDPSTPVAQVSLYFLRMNRHWYSVVLLQKSDSSGYSSYLYRAACKQSAPPSAPAYRIADWN